jgi:hypothetical protein
LFWKVFLNFTVCICAIISSLSITIVGNYWSHFTSFITGNPLLQNIQCIRQLKFPCNSKNMMCPKLNYFFLSYEISLLTCAFGSEESSEAFQLFNNRRRQQMYTDSWPYHK